MQWALASFGGVGKIEKEEERKGRKNWLVSGAWLWGVVFWMRIAKAERVGWDHGRLRVECERGAVVIYFITLTPESCLPVRIPCPFLLIHFFGWIYLFSSFLSFYISAFLHIFLFGSMLHSNLNCQRESPSIWRLGDVTDEAYSMDGWKLSQVWTLVIAFGSWELGVGTQHHE